LSVDHTRVVLKDGDPNVPGSDYINANYISVMLSLAVLPYITFVTAENFVYAVCSLVKSWQQYVTILCLFLVVAQSYRHCPFSLLPSVSSAS